MGLYKGKIGFVHYSFISNGAWAYKKVWNLSFGLGFDDGIILRWNTSVDFPPKGFTLSGSLEPVHTRLNNSKGLS